jgi:hypothetical protein
MEPDYRGKGGTRGSSANGCFLVHFAEAGKRLQVGRLLPDDGVSPLSTLPPLASLKSSR